MNLTQQARKYRADLEKERPWLVSTIHEQKKCPICKENWIVSWIDGAGKITVVGEGENCSDCTAFLKSRGGK